MLMCVPSSITLQRQPLALPYKGSTMACMDTTQARGYTAKLIDGPLEGKTISTAFLESGDPQPLIEIPAEAGDKRFSYARAGGLEFGGDAGERPTAVEYRYRETLFN